MRGQNPSTLMIIFVTYFFVLCLCHVSSSSLCLFFYFLFIFLNNRDPLRGKGRESGTRKYSGGVEEKVGITYTVSRFG